MDRATLLTIARSGALDEISNGGGVEHYIRNFGMVRDGKTNKALLFFIYQTGRYGPQNGFRLCLVQEGFEVDASDAATQFQQVEADVGLAAEEVVILYGLPSAQPQLKRWTGDD